MFKSWLHEICQHLHNLTFRKAKSFHPVQQLLTKKLQNFDNILNKFYRRCTLGLNLFRDLGDIYNLIQIWSRNDKVKMPPKTAKYA